MSIRSLSNVLRPLPQQMAGVPPLEEAFSAAGNVNQVAVAITNGTQPFDSQVSSIDAGRISVTPNAGATERMEAGASQISRQSPGLIRQTHRDDSRRLCAFPPTRREGRPQENPLFVHQSCRTLADVFEVVSQFPPTIAQEGLRLRGTSLTVLIPHSPPLLTLREENDHPNPATLAQTETASMITQELEELTQLMQAEDSGSEERLLSLYRSAYNRTRSLIQSFSEDSR